jgi:hypothetical protein
MSTMSQCRLLDDTATQLTLTYGPDVCTLDGTTLWVDFRHPRAHDAWTMARRLLRDWPRDVNPLAAA